VIHVHKLAQRRAALVQRLHVTLAVLAATLAVATLARKNVLGGKFLKTKLVATNATTNVTAATAQKELTGTNSGLTDV
jgi:hypothetical protein